MYLLNRQINGGQGLSEPLHVLIDYIMMVTKHGIYQVYVLIKSPNQRWTRSLETFAHTD